MTVRLILISAACIACVPLALGLMLNAIDRKKKSCQ
jgi:hypothetical protein